MIRILSALSVVALLLTAAGPAGAQGGAPPAPAAQQSSADAIGSVATLTGSATVTRGNATGALKVNDDIFKGDQLQTAGNSTLAITLDDETTFTMGATARMTMDEFAYASGAKNSAAYNVLRGTVAFVAGHVAKTGSMSIATPTATFGIRGTTGLVEVPEGAGTSSQVAVKLYPDSNGAVGRIEVFAPGTGGARLGILTRASSGFGIGPAVAGRFAAVPLTISPQQVARDRGFVRQMFSYHTIGSRIAIERRSVRPRGFPPGQQRPDLRRPEQQRQNLQRQNLQQQRQTRPQDLQRQNLQQRPDPRGPTLQGMPPRGPAPRFERSLPGLQQPAPRGAPALRGRSPRQQQLPGEQPPDRRNQRQFIR